MIIFNDTVILEEATHLRWLKWMKEFYIPEVMATGFFKSFEILNIIDSPNEGVTYCVQYRAANMADFNQFYLKHLHKFQEIHNREFENLFVIFNTLMQTVE
jgi:transposase-like protein